MPVEEYRDEGLLKLAEALVKNAKEDCMSSIQAGDFIRARIVADMDQRGIVGKIVGFATQGQMTFEDIINEEIKDFSQLKGWW